MKYSALVIGYGSIGKRHAGILAEMNRVSTVTVLSHQENIPYKKINGLEQVTQLDPDYIVIASNTALHHLQLAELEKRLSNKVILVEKPLFEKYYELKPTHNSVWVGYVLRFHPVVQFIRKEIDQKTIWNVNLFCGSYLPDWRPGQDYHKTYSAQKDGGGGVLLDISHELDYCRWLFGDIEIDYVYSSKVSDLNIETDDMLILNGHTNTGTQVQMNLNYFSRIPLRQIVIDGKGISIQADIIANKATINLNGTLQEHAWADFEIDTIYREEHESVLSSDNSTACTFEEGVETMQLIEKIRSYPKK